MAYCVASSIGARSFGTVLCGNSVATESYRESLLRKIERLLVTGGAGFIGSAFLRYLLQSPSLFSGHVYNCDALTYAGNRENLAAIESDPRYHFLHGDICDSPFLASLCREEGIDTIIHFAAESHVDRSIKGPKAFVETNVMGTFHLLEVVRNQPSIHFHHVSTDEVFGSIAEGLFHEHSPYCPNSPYSASKAASDHFVRAYTHTYGLSTCISNCSNNYGPYQFPEKLLPLMILRATKGEVLPIYGTGENVRDWLFVEDHAEALWLLLQKGKAGETYNIGGHCEKSNLEVVKEMLFHLAPKIGISQKELYSLLTFVQDRPGHDFRYAIDTTKIQKELHWRPKHTFSEGLEKTIDWYLANQEWISRVETGEYRSWISSHYPSDWAVLESRNI